MNRTLVPALVLAFGLAACSPNSPAPSSAANTTPTNASSTAASSATILGHGTGRVVAIDAAAGTVTIEHGPIPEANWPAMTMAFRSSPAALNGIAVGDQVSFDITITNGAGEVTAVRKTS